MNNRSIVAAALCLAAAFTTLIAAIALVCALAARPAHALEAPARSAEDPNMRVVPYKPMQRVRLIGTVGRVTNITYNKKETISRVTFGDDFGSDDVVKHDTFWAPPEPAEVAKAPLKNNLPLWPRRPGKTNLTVTTFDEKGEEHVYQYDLISRPASEADDPEAIYGLTYTYGAREAEARREAQTIAYAPVAAARQEARARARLAADRAAAPRNWHYTGQGNMSLAPVETWDDGQQTFLRYQGQQHVPAVFTVAPDGSEQTAMTSMDGEILVVHQVDAELHLRLGASVLYIWNRAFNPIGVNPSTGAPADPGTGTSSPNVVRVIRQAAGQG